MLLSSVPYNCKRVFDWEGRLKIIIIHPWRSHHGRGTHCIKASYIHHLISSLLKPYEALSLCSHYRWGHRGLYISPLVYFSSQSFASETPWPGEDTDVSRHGWFQAVKEWVALLVLVYFSDCSSVHTSILTFQLKFLRRTCSVETPDSVFVSQKLPTLSVLAALSWQGEPGHGVCMPEVAWMSSPCESCACCLVPPLTSGTKVMRMFHFALYIWNLDSLKAGFLCPSQNVQIIALCQG